MRAMIKRIGMLVPLLALIAALVGATTAEAATTFSVSATVSPTSVTAGSSVSYAVRVLNTGTTTGSASVNVQLIDPAGSVAYQRTFNYRQVKPRRSVSPKASYTLPSAALAGTWQLRVKVQNGTLTTTYYNNTAATFTVVAPASSTTPTPTPAPTPSPTPTPTSGLQHGVYIPGAAQDMSILAAYEQLTGKPTKIVHWYQPWGQDYSNGSWFQPVLDTKALNDVAAHGATPMITWEAWGTIDGKNTSVLDNITAGSFNAYIDSWAVGLAQYGKPVYLRLFHEMNNSGYPWAYGNNGNTADDLINAWRYVHDRFVAKGATNVLWVWAPNTQNSLVDLRQIYPGDAYVDWLGVDGYNGGSELWGLGWRTPETVFGPTLTTYAQMAPSKPIMISETSTVEAGGSKAQWITDLFGSFAAAHPQVKAIVWFHADLRSRGEGDWRVNTSQTALDAYKAALATLP